MNEAAPHPDRSETTLPGAQPTPEAVESRAHLLPEEAAAGSDDPERQAEAILEESAERVLRGASMDAAQVERRASADTVPPADED